VAARRHSARPVQARSRRYALSMAKRSKKPADLNRLAKAIVGDATDEASQPLHQKNAAAVELGRAGGLKGGKARAANMTAEQRSKAARKAAKARWSKDRSP
jgi:hypothetical protein